MNAFGAEVGIRSRRWLSTTIITVMLVLMFCINMHGLVMFCTVRGESMAPTLEDGSHGMCFLKKDAEISRGDIIIARLNSELIVKRVIAVEGDSVLIDNGKVIVNGKELTEDYVKYKSSLDYVDVIVGQGECYVLGDNRSNSLDSRYFGTIAKEDILGRFYEVCM